MSKRALLIIILSWCLLTIVNYYFTPYFIVGLSWFILSLLFLIIAVIQLLQIFWERRSLSRFRVMKAITFWVLFILTFKVYIVNGIIEKVDWLIFYDKRMDIVQQVKTGKLVPETEFNNGNCELPFEFPVISNGGNEIMIDRNIKEKTTTVKFWVFRNFFSSPSTQFIFTDDSSEIRDIQRMISIDPDNNWKIRDNWYRVHGHQ